MKINSLNNLKKVDDNNDNKISIKELEKIDVNHDGKISAFESESVGIDPKDLHEINNIYNSHKSKPSEIIFNLSISSDDLKVSRLLKQMDLGNKSFITKDDLNNFKEKVKNGNINIESINLIDKLCDKAKQINSEKDLYCPNKDIASSGSFKPFAISLKDFLKINLKNKVLSGKNDGIKSVFNPNRTIDECIKVIKNYPNFKGAGISQSSLFPSNSGVNPDKVNKIDFYKLMGSSSSPDINGGGSSYEKLVGLKLPDGKSYIDKVRDNLLKTQKTNLTPADVLKCALDATKGDYGIAVIASHNLLKSIAYNGRTENGASELSSDELKIISKLGNLRSNHTDSKDKMGPWYHFFGVQASMSITSSSSVTNGLVSFEQISRSAVIRHTRNLMNYPLSPLGIKLAPSSKDDEKASVDNASCKLADKLMKL